RPGWVPAPRSGQARRLGCASASRSGQALCRRSATMNHRGSILLVDDEDKILRALGRALRDAGHVVVDTTSPRQAQRLLGEQAFDVFVVDNVMPELNGLDLIREFIAATPEHERPQILMMTAHATV